MKQSMQRNWKPILAAFAASCIVTLIGVNFFFGPIAGSDIPSEPFLSPAYSIQGDIVKLENGIFDGEDGTVTLMTVTSGDLDGDTHDDQAVILVHNSRGSGVFYYLNVHLNDGNGSLGLAGEVLLGDRIEVDLMDIYRAGSVSRLTGVPIHPDDYGQLMVGYYIYGQDQAYAENPTVYLARHWKIDDGNLVSLENY